ncbi:MAG: RNA methyltransferase [Nitrososphaerales archaeon]
MVEPEYAMNVGYVARVMANFGVSDLYVIGRKQDLDRSKMFKFASHGERIIETMRVLKSLEVLKGRFNILIGTTAIRARRKSNITRGTFDLEKSLPLIFSHIPRLDQKKDICLVFGRDTTGLTNSELRLCDYAVTINTGTSYNTLNISHACGIILYKLAEYSRSHSGIKPKVSRFSDVKEKRRIVELFAELALLSDYQEHKKDKFELAMRRMLNRSSPSLKELYFIMGLVSKANSKIKSLANHAA